MIGQSGARASNLCLEITETVFMEDAEAVMRVIERVRALGVRFAIDDFGTGYSSLGYLKRFAVDSVKIDRAFVNGLAEDSGDLAIVTAVIGLAHALGLRVVAEGVESEAQLGRARRPRLRRSAGLFLRAAATCGRPPAARLERPALAPARSVH